MRGLFYAAPKCLQNRLLSGFIKSRAKSIGSSGSAIHEV